MNIPIAKKAMLISGIIQIAVVCLITFLANHRDWGGHTAFGVGALLQFPASVPGVLIGEQLQSATGSGALSVSTAIAITLLLQFVILSAVIYWIITKRLK